MTNGNIEILGQKFSYPNTWHGTFSVLFVGLTFFSIAYLAKGWATPEIVDGLRGLNSASEKQENINKRIIENMDALSKRLTAIETNAILASQKNTSPTKEKLERSKSEIQSNSLYQLLELSKLKEEVNNQALSRLENVAPIVEPARLVSQKIEQQKAASQEVQQQQYQIQQQQQQIQQKWR